MVTAMSAVGRPRNHSREVEVLELLAAGQSASAIARKLGIHRNSVYFIKNRPLSVDSEAALEVSHIEEQIEVIKRERDEIQQRERLAIEEAKVVKRKAAIKALLAWFEKAADAVDKGRSVWLSMDAEFAGGGTMHDVSEDRSAESPDLVAAKNELGQMLSNAMESLSEIQRRVMQMVFWEGRTLAEIASELDTDESTIVQIESEGMKVLRAGVVL